MFNSVLKAEKCWLLRELFARSSMVRFLVYRIESDIIRAFVCLLQHLSDCITVSTLTRTKVGKLSLNAQVSRSRWYLDAN